MGTVRSIDRTIPAHYGAQSRGIIHKECAISDAVAFFLIEALLSDNGAETKASATFVACQSTQECGRFPAA
jgi:hypothetical protein